MRYKLRKIFRTARRKPALVLLALYAVSAVYTLIKYPVMIPINMTTGKEPVYTLIYLAVASFFMCGGLFSVMRGGGLKGWATVIVLFFFHFYFIFS